MLLAAGAKVYLSEASRRRVSHHYYQRQEPRSGFTTPDASRRPYLTWTLLALNILAWLVLTAAGGSDRTDVLLKFGAMSGPHIADGQYWRLFTAMFLHAGLTHLLLNAVGLFIFGRIVEGIYGHARFALIYVLAGLGGSVLSYMLNSPGAVGVGASGAIFGVLAALAAFFVARRGTLGEMARQNLTGILIMVAINLFFGFASPGIDNWAHVGGFVVGFAIGFAVVPNYQALRDPMRFTTSLVDYNPLRRKWGVLPIVLGALALGILLGNATLPDSPISRLNSAQRYLEQQGYEEAVAELTDAIRLDPFFGEAYYIRGLVRYELGDVARARSDLTAALQLGLEGEPREQAVALLVDLTAR